MRQAHVSHHAAMAGLLLALTTSPAAAEVHLSGTQDDMVLRTKDAAMPEIIAEVEAALHVKITLLASTPRQFSGSYSGSLHEVLQRLGVSYVFTSSPEEINIAILTPSGPQRAAPSGPPAAVLVAATGPMAPQEGSRRSAQRLEPNMNKNVKIAFALAGALAFGASQATAFPTEATASKAALSNIARTQWHGTQLVDPHCLKPNWARQCRWHLRRSEAWPGVPKFEEPTYYPDYGWHRCWWGERC